MKNKKYKGPGIYNTSTGELLAPIEQEFYEHRGPLHVYWIKNKEEWKKIMNKTKSMMLIE